MAGIQLCQSVRGNRSFTLVGLPMRDLSGVFFKTRR